MTILSRFFSQEFTSIASQSWQQDWGRGLLSLPADVLWGSFVTHSFMKGMRDKRTLKDVCVEARGSSCRAQLFNNLKFPTLPPHPRRHNPKKL